ncbi:MAG: adenine deaminase C-terminal domain-containing protein, partial [Anaerolineae bacterium]|nr:adenine deaminase C-terminal domain-containing protein [Anaerolineae bacterium]
DPHEITNVMGLAGIRYMLEASQGLPLRYYITAPSCVPAVPSLETAGAEITWQEMEQMLSWDRVVAVAEAMDFQGLIYQGGNITPIVEVAHRQHIGIEGHAPAVSGRNLQAYTAAIGPLGSDHEATMTDEMLEKVRSGMMIYARSSTFLDDSANTAAAVKEVNDTRMFGFCTDDIMPHHLGRGHLNYGIRQLIKEGVEPMTAVQMGTINNAQHYRLYGLGAIAAGWLADIVLLDSLEELNAQYVIVDGNIVVKGGKLVADIQEPVEPLMANSVKIVGGLTADDFRKLGSGSGQVCFNAMNMASIFTTLDQVTAEIEDGLLKLPLPEGVAIAAIVPRHGQNKPPALCLTTGYALEKGAIASTVSHDSHNLVIVGKNPQDMMVAMLEILHAGGGLTAVKNGKILSTVPLPIAGLMSPLEVAEIGGILERFEACLPELGLPHAFPIDLLALALPVIPQVRLTDFGLVDIVSQQVIPATVS